MNQNLFSMWRLYFISIGYALVVTPEITLISLQSSISVKDALGSSSLVVYSLICVIFVLGYAPLVAKIGRKKCLIVSEIPSVVYTIALMHQNIWSLTIGAVLLGMAEGTLVSAAGATVSSFNDDGRDGTSRKKSIGIFLTTLSLFQIVTSILPKLTLIDSNDQWNMTDSDIIGGFDVSNCGRNDCPLDYAFKKEASVFGQLIPTNTSLILLLSIFAFLQVIGIILHCVVIQREQTPQPVSTNEKTQEALPKSLSARSNFLQAFHKLIVHMKSRLRLLTIPIHLQYGAYCAFLWSEVTRAYISCPLGVENLGICLTLIYTASTLVYFIFSRFSSSFSQPQLFWLSYLFETTGYIVAFLWQPSVYSLYVSYILNVLVGITYAMRRISAYSVSSVYFNDLDSSYLVQTGFVALGSCMMYTMTSIVCVYVKIYVLAVLSLSSTVLATVAHYRYS